MWKLRVKHPSQDGKAAFKVKRRCWSLTFSTEVWLLWVLRKAQGEAGTRVDAINHPKGAAMFPGDRL